MPIGMRPRPIFNVNRSGVHEMFIEYLDRLNPIQHFDLCDASRVELNLRNIYIPRSSFIVVKTSLVTKVPLQIGIEESVRKRTPVGSIPTNQVERTMDETMLRFQNIFSVEKPGVNDRSFW